jgi:hypothetical protein
MRRRHPLTRAALALILGATAGCSGSNGSAGNLGTTDGGGDGAAQSEAGGDSSIPGDGGGLRDGSTADAPDSASGQDSGGGQDSASAQDSTSTQDSGTQDSSSTHDSSTPDARSDSGPTGCTITDPSQDMDLDGWTPAQGDCNDCNPNVNPGAVDFPQQPGPDGGLTPAIDSDCDGTFDPPAPCDTGLALDDVTATDGAKALELCRFTTASPPLPQKTWGVISAQYVRADGTAFAAPGLQVGLQPSWGANVNPRAGKSMLALSSGHARTPAQPGACGSNSCATNATATAPAGFPQSIPSCPPSSVITDDVALQVQVRVPTNAAGFSFQQKFYSMEFPYWVCTPYNDQFVALMSPAPMGAINGNFAFDSQNAPVGVNIAFMSVCDPTQQSQFAAGCTSGGGACPMAPSPYCPAGVGDLAGTGFDVWDTMYGNAGATPWLATQAPVKGGSVITLTFILWDTGDQNFDSTELLDDFTWLPGPTAIGTSPG